MRRMSSKLRCLVVNLFVSVLVSTTVMAEVETISIKSGDVVSQDVTINPGFAVMFQFPKDVLALTLADQTAFACDKMPTDLTRILCKPLTQNSFATNLVVTTENNEFNLVLKVDPSGGKHPFKYVFSDGKSPVTVGHTSVLSTSDSSAPAKNLMDLVLDHYDTQPCRLKGDTLSVHFRCLDTIEIGADKFVRFSLSGKSSHPVKIVKIVLSRESLGGLTGLAVKEESSLDVDYSLKSDTLGSSEETAGILRMPREDQNQNKRLCLVVMTDQGRESDVRVYGL